MNNREQKNIWGALRAPFFRILWAANVVSLIGTWMHEVSVSWLMTSMTLAPLIIALVQTSMVFPFFLLSLPAGALADIIDRRRLLIAAQLLMLAAATGLGIVTLLGSITPVVLLLFTFVLGLGASVNAPAWQAIMPELIPREDLPSAITLGSVAFNIARVIGPVLGGIVIGIVGPGTTFLLNALSFSGVLFALFLWKRQPTEQTLPAERLMGAIKTGIRYTRNAPQVRAILIHIGVFSFFGSSLWAFLPIIARSRLGLNPSGYGILFGFFGLGGLIGAALLPKVSHISSMNKLVATSTAFFGLTIAILAFSDSYIFIAAALFIGGVAWLILISTFNISLQSIIPSWVRGRVLSVFMLVFFGAMAGGSALWGLIASWRGIPVTLAITSASMVAAIFLTQQYRLKSGDNLDLTPVQRWPQVIGKIEPAMEDGPVLVVIEYHIDPGQSKAFMESMRPLKTIRMRDGAFKWNLFRDATNPDHYIESFIVESWAEHLRQHERFTVADKEAHNRVRSFHTGEPISALHFIAEPIRREK
jgi:MFS family permease